MDIWQIIKWLANADTLGNTRNVMSIAIGLCMFLFAFRNSLKLKRGMLRSFTDTIIFTYFFYAIVDFANNMLWNSTVITYATFTGRQFRIEPFGFMTTFGNIIIAVPFYFYVRRNKSLVNMKALLMTMILSLTLMALTITAFGTWSMRDLTGDARVYFYVFSFLPLWSLWAIGYTRFLKPKPSLPCVFFKGIPSEKHRPPHVFPAKGTGKRCFPYVFPEANPYQASARARANVRRKAFPNVFPAPMQSKRARAISTTYMRGW